MLAQLEQVAPTPATVLLLGETGSGKEVMAQAIHDSSPRHHRPMIRVSCAAIPTALIESELFGRERGAYTGALSRQIGRFEAAHQSTLFLDEIGELPMEVQVKLLRVLQERVIERLGSTQSIKVDVRIIAATNRNLEEAVRDKTFREDLFYRLNVFPVVVPPLRERVEDIPALVWSFVDEFSRSFGKTIDSIPKDCMRELQRYPWPGNVRELRNVIERAVIVATGRQLVVWPPRVEQRPVPQAAMTLCALEGDHIRAVLDSTNWRDSRRRGRGGASRPQADHAREPDGAARHHAKESWIERGRQVAADGSEPDNGTRARMDVPAPGRDSMTRSPSTRRTRSCMPISPSPRPLRTASTIEADTRVHDLESNVIRTSAQRDGHVAHAGVPDRVRHGFLQHSEQTTAPRDSARRPECRHG